jgi:hypothetical protein
MMHYGVGLHAWDVTPENFTKFAEVSIALVLSGKPIRDGVLTGMEKQLINIQQILYMPAISFTKISILVQFLHIFVTGKRNWRSYILWSLIALNAIFFSILFFLEIFQCIPRAKIWNPSLAGKCINIQQTFVASAVINICDDFTILTLPLFWIWTLQMGRKKKLGVSLIFATGLL